MLCAMFRCACGVRGFGVDTAGPAPTPVVSRVVDESWFCECER